MNKLIVALFLAQLFPVLSNAQDHSAKEILDDCINAHGGIKKWNKYSGLMYTVYSNGEKSDQTIQLKDRRTYHNTQSYEMGFDGNSTWIKGDKDAIPTKNPDFFHNIDFYFFAMPFVINDPGTKINYGGEMTIKGFTYHVLDISYEDGVGVASNDIYKLFINPNTKQMEWLLYSVTFFDKLSTKLSAKHYTEWRWVNGLLVPTTMENFKFQDGNIVGEPGSPRRFEAIKFVKKLKDETIFEKN